jgi:hypothetical protein
MQRANINIGDWEKHNVVDDGSGGLMTRNVFSNLLTLSGRCVGAFSVRSPSTTDVWHYVFTQAVTTGVVTLTVYTEEFVSLYTYPLGAISDSPVITHAVVNNQLVISSPSFSTTLYGLVGGGVMAAVAQPSLNPDTTALDIPTGYCCSFGDRVVIAQGQVVFFSDPGIDPRTFVAENALALPGAVLDIFQGVDGALYMFTTAGIYSLPADAIGQGQSVVGYLSRIPGLSTMRPRNACPTPFGVAMLDESDLVLLNNGTRIPLGTYAGQRSLSRVVDVDDLRIFGEVYPTQNGVLIGFRTTREFYVSVDLRTNTASYIYEVNAMSLMGVLTDRDGWENHIVESAGAGATVVLSQEITGTTEFTGDELPATLCGTLEIGPSQRPLLRRASASFSLAGALIRGEVERKLDTVLATTNNAVMVGTDLWASAGNCAGRSLKSSRLTFNARSSNPSIEIQFTGGGFAASSTLQVESSGLHPGVKDKQQ